MVDVEGLRFSSKHMNISKRLNTIEASGIRKVFEKSLAMGDKAINLSIGQPHFPVDERLKRYAQEAIADNFNAYMPTMGYLPLREKIAKKLNAENNIDADVEDVMITAGVSGGLYLLFASLIDPGDEVILPDPYFVLYEQVLKYLGAKIVLHDTYPDFRLHAERLETLITPRTKLIIVNSPNNPTGMVYSETELRELAAIAAKHDLPIMSDEIYEAFDYDKKFFSIGSIYKNTITLNGFSKNLAITGWRLGYAHGPKEIIQAMNKLQMYTFVCAPSFAQVAVARVMDELLEIYDYRPNRDYLYDELKNHFEFNKPEGAFYAYLRIPESRKDFISELDKKNLLVVPGDVFSGRGDYFRVSFAVNKNLLQDGLASLLGIL